MENEELKQTQDSGGSPLNDGLDGWIDAKKIQPDFITGERHSKNVWGWDGERVIVVAWCVDIDEGYYWSNSYGNVFGEPEFDDDYDIKFWQPIKIPMPPNAELTRADD